MSRSLAGRTVLISGSGSGLGQATAVAAAKAGAHVIVTSLGDNGEETVAMIAKVGGRASWLQLDVTERAAVEAAVEKAVALTGRLDGVVHNAVARLAFDDPKEVLVGELTRELWEHEAAVSMRGAFYLARAAFPHLAAATDGGRLVLVTSTAGIEGTPYHPAYAACKGALRALAKSLAREWGPLGVTVNLVSPTAATATQAAMWQLYPELRETTKKLTALGFIGEPERDVGPVFVFLLDGASHYVTGQTLLVDAGRYMAF